MTHPSKPAVVGYTRVSTKRQVREGISLDTQRQQLERWCEASGVQLLGMFTDEGRSGKNANRPGLQAAMQMALEHGAGVVVPSLSRFGRSMADLVNLHQKLHSAGLRFVSIKEGIDTGTATGRLVAHIFGALAEFEREQIVERISDTLQTKRERGEKLGGQVPLGYSVVRHVGRKPQLVANTDEQLVLRRITELRGTGMGYRAIALALTTENVPTKAGGRWASKTVRQVWLRLQAGQQASTGGV